MPRDIDISSSFGNYIAGKKSLQEIVITNNKFLYSIFLELRTENFISFGELSQSRYFIFWVYTEHIKKYIPQYKCWFFLVIYVKLLRAKYMTLNFWVYIFLVSRWSWRELAVRRQNNIVVFSHRSGQVRLNIYFHCYFLVSVNACVNMHQDGYVILCKPLHAEQI